MCCVHTPSRATPRPAFRMTRQIPSLLPLTATSSQHDVFSHAGPRPAGACFCRMLFGLTAFLLRGRVITGRVDVFLGTPWLARQLRSSCLNQECFCRGYPRRACKCHHMGFLVVWSCRSSINIDPTHRQVVVAQACDTSGVGVGERRSHHPAFTASDHATEYVAPCNLHG